MWTAGKKYSPPSRPTRFKIDSTDNDVATEREQSQKNAFCSLIGEEEECPSSALFICQRNVLHLRIIVHSVSLCRVLCAEGEARRRGRAIKWFSRPSTSGWQSDKISHFSSSSSSVSFSLSRITISREMKKFFWCERSHRFRRRVECVGLMPSPATLRRGFFGGRRFLFFNNERFTKGERSKKRIAEFFSE